LHKNDLATCGGKEAPHRGKGFPIEEIGEDGGPNDNCPEKFDGPVR
jgi:hypothetical protein